MIKFRGFTALAPVLIAATAMFCVASKAQTQDATRVKFVTTAGDFVLELYPGKAPKTVENFLQYVKDKHYDGTIFHRVINNFMIQGGGYDAKFNQRSTRDPIPLEANNGLKNELGTVAMARTSNPNSATAQFFINVKDNVRLNAPEPDGYGYTVFGKVIKGMDVVERIKAKPTAAAGPFPSDVPKTPILINTATLIK